MLVFPEYDETSHVNEAEAYANSISNLLISERKYLFTQYIS